MDSGAGKAAQGANHSGAHAVERGRCCYKSVASQENPYAHGSHAFFWNESGEQVGFDELMEEVYKQDRKMSFKEALQILRTEQSRVKMSDVKRVARDH